MNSRGSQFLHIAPLSRHVQAARKNQWMKIRVKALSGNKLVTHGSKLFDILGTFLADCVGFTVNNKQGITFKEVHLISINKHWNSSVGGWIYISPLLLEFRSAVCALHYWMCDATLLWGQSKGMSAFSWASVGKGCRINSYMDTSEKPPKLLNIKHNFMFVYQKNTLWLHHLWKHLHMIASVHAENKDYHVTLIAIL